MGFEPPSPSAQDTVKSEVTDGPICDLSVCLSYLRSQQPELAALTEAWPTLPAPVKAGILAMVKAVK